MLDAQQQQQIINALLKRKQNSVCADCNGKSPCWASLDFGVFICLNCSGGHRALGPSVTRVKSTKLDTWNREWLQNMQLGNSVLNEYWEYQLTGSNSSLKPNTNSSVSDIIKYVQEKYLKKRYVDQRQKLDPLQRYKQYPHSSVKNESQEPKSKTNFKQPSKPSLNQIPRNHSQKQNYVQKQQLECPFAAFDKIAAEKKTKIPENLISFEEGALKKTDKNNFAFFQFQPKETKYEKNQFKTTNAKPSSSSLPIDFQFIFKQKLGPQTQTNNGQHQNYFLGSPTNQNAAVFNVNQHISHSLPHNDKNQYTTMNINMNMYPKVVNINMNHNHYGYDPFATTAHYGTLGYNQQPSIFPQQQTAGFTKQQYTPNIPKYPSIKNIKLQSNINLSQKNKPQPRQQSTSWVDDWK